MAYKVKRANRFLNRILKKTLGPYLVWRYNIEFIEGNMEGLKPPFVVIGNHTNNWDPFIISLKISEPIHFRHNHRTVQKPHHAFPAWTCRLHSEN